MLILNFSHPLTAAQCADIEQITGRSITRVIDQLAQFDHGAPFAPQVAALADAMGLSPEAWQTEPLLVNLPGYAPGATGLIAEIHGRTGYFPAILRLRPVEGSTPVIYSVAEIVNLQQIREQARLSRQRG